MSLSRGTGRCRRILAGLSVLIGVVLAGHTAADEPALDVIIFGGTVYDGSGAPGQRLDVGIQDDRIVILGDLADLAAQQRVNATGLAVTPGFIDIHSHAVKRQAEESGLFQWPAAENYIRQGVTTAIGGPDGRSWLPIGPLLALVDDSDVAINFGTFVGHNRVRESVMGREQRLATPDEIILMQAQVETAMREGAFGLSSGLKYIPGNYADTNELVELSRVAGRHGGIYITHMRDEGPGLLDSVRETLTIGEGAGLPVQVTHHKAMGRSMWGQSANSLALLDEARALGVDATSDAYPYTASSTGLSVLFPAWSLEGNRASRRARLDDPQQRPMIRDGIVESLRMDRGGNDLSRVVIADCPADRSWNGMDLGEALATQDQAGTLENAAELIMALEYEGGCTAVYHSMTDEDVDRILQHPGTMVASDGGIYEAGPSVPHPRNYGAFARVLGVYVRERGVLDFSTAIHKMSQMPADRIGLSERGRITPGAYADIAVLDPELVIDLATFEQPHQLAEGVLHVWVNGQPVMLDGVLTGERPGRALRSTD